MHRWRTAEESQGGRQRGGVTAAPPPAAAPRAEAVPEGTGRQRAPGPSEGPGLRTLAPEVLDIPGPASVRVSTVYIYIRDLGSKAAARFGFTLVTEVVEELL